MVALLGTIRIVGFGCGIGVHSGGLSVLCCTSSSWQCYAVLVVVVTAGGVVLEWLCC